MVKRASCTDKAEKGRHSVGPSGCPNTRGLAVSTFGARWYTDQRYWSMQVPLAEPEVNVNPLEALDECVLSEE